MGDRYAELRTNGRGGVAHVVRPAVEGDRAICGHDTAGYSAVDTFPDARAVLNQRGSYGWPGWWCRNCLRWLERW